MLHSVLFLRCLGVVPVIHGSHKITCNTSYPFKALIAVVLSSVTARAFVVYDTCISANRVSVHRMIDGAISHAAFLHASYHLLECVQILAWVSVKLHIRYMTAVGERVIRRLQLDFIKSIDIVINRYMEGISIVFPVRNAFYYSVLYPVYPYESSRQTLCRSRYERIVEACRLGGVSVPCFKTSATESSYLSLSESIHMP